MKTATSVKAQIKYRANKEKRNVQDAPPYEHLSLLEGFFCAFWGIFSF